MHNQKGFTIIELIVVIAIISVLAAIVTATVIGYIKKSKDAVSFAELRQVTTLATDWYNTNGSYDGFRDSPKVSQLQTELMRNGYALKIYEHGGDIWWNGGYVEDNFGNSVCNGKWWAELIISASSGTPAFVCADSSGFVGTGRSGDYNSCSCR